MAIKLSSIKTIISGFNQLTALNSNFQAIAAKLDSFLSRDGTAPNQMEAPLDMNGQQLVNLAKPSTPTSPIRVVDLTDGTLTIDLSSAIPDGTVTQAQLVQAVQDLLTYISTIKASSDPYPQYALDVDIPTIPVTSVDGKTGAVDLSAEYDAAGTAETLFNQAASTAPVQSVDGKTGQVVLGDTYDAKGTAQGLIDALTYNDLATKPTLGDIDKVILTSPTKGQTIQWDGYNWVNVEATATISDEEFLTKLVSALSAGTGISISVVNGNVQITNTGSGSGSTTPVVTYHFSLEDGSGDILMEDGTSYLLLEEAA